MTLALLLAALAGAPLLAGVVNRTKSVVAGRRGAPLLQLYFDLAKLARKRPVYSRTTTFLFRLGPALSLAGALAAALLVPFGGAPAALRFAGDFVVFAGLLSAGRFATVLAALDTGSPFEGMGASREVTFAALAEPALFLALLVLALATRTPSLSGMLGGALPAAWGHAAPALALALAALGVVALAENARIPVDDPNTHLELTMIHEVMVLDHGGPDLALILYGAALKLLLFGALFARLLVAVPAERPAVALAGFAGGTLLFGILVGLVESTMARLRMARVPQLLAGATVLALFGLVLLLR